MMSRKLMAGIAVVLFSSGCTATSGTSFGMMMGGGRALGMSPVHAPAAPMDPAAKAQAVPSLAQMLQRADSLVMRAERLVSAAHTDTTGHAMMMSHGAAGSAPAGANSVLEMAMGLRGLLRHLDAMHRAGMPMEGAAATAMHELHQRSATLLSEVEQTMQAMERMHAMHGKTTR
ncbi:MAG: hypothetical protein HYV19_04650 [Gemmatimonadetes bacterium]|nr:hypothetical protein [Gemmatimonadota bacterium]